MKPFLCKGGMDLRERIDNCFMERSKKSDGWIGDKRHAAMGWKKSQHNPAPNGAVRAIDITSDLDQFDNTSSYLADQLRLFAKHDKQKRIWYVIHKGRIASQILNYKWRKYSGDPHDKHIHISFNPQADKVGFTESDFDKIPLLSKDKQ